MIIKNQTLFYNGPESSLSMEWSNEADIQHTETKSDFKTSFAYINDPRSHIQNIFSTSNIKLGGRQSRNNPNNELQPKFVSTSRLDSLKLDAPNNEKKDLFEISRAASLNVMRNLSAQSQPAQKQGLTSPPGGVYLVEKSPVSANGSRLPSFHNLCGYQPPHSKWKISLPVDQEALLTNKKFQDVVKKLKNTTAFGDIEHKDLTASLFHLSTYFEVVLQRLFYENKEKFSSSPFFRMLFAEEISKEKDQCKRASTIQEPLSKLGSV